MIVRDALIAMRPAQWVKNAFVLVGPLFGHRWAGEDLLRGGLAFVVFCLASSAVYLYNDWVDREADRRHPAKRERPIAAARIGGFTVALLIVMALSGAYAGACFLGAPMAFLVSGYLGLNVAYTLALKHVVIADVFAIAGGFQLRLLAGTIGLGIPPSQWLLLCGFSLTLLLALGKRRGELVAHGEAGDTRRVLGDYSLPLVDQLIGICAALTLAAYGLYTISSETVAIHRGVNLAATIPIVTYGVFRYLHVLRSDDDGDVGGMVFGDRHLLGASVAWLIAVIAIMR